MAWRAVPDVDTALVDALAAKVIRFLETGDVPEGQAEHATAVTLIRP